MFDGSQPSRSPPSTSAPPKQGQFVRSPLHPGQIHRPPLFTRIHQKRTSAQGAWTKISWEFCSGSAKERASTWCFLFFLQRWMLSLQMTISVLLSVHTYRVHIIYIYIHTYDYTYLIGLEMLTHIIFIYIYVILYVCFYSTYTFNKHSIADPQKFMLQIQRLCFDSVIFKTQENHTLPKTNISLDFLNGWFR